MNELLLLGSVVLIFGTAILAYFLFGKTGLYCVSVLATAFANVEAAILIFPYSEPELAFVHAGRGRHCVVSSKRRILKHSEANFCLACSICRQPVFRRMAVPQMVEINRKEIRRQKEIFMAEK